MDDACPGILRLTEAADGWLARVRIPGGFLTSQGISALVATTSELGDGRLELTSRGNVQLRGLAASAAAELSGRLADAGLLPSFTHERVRNIVASPLAGLDSPVPLEPVVRALDAALCGSPRMAELSGRFLFAIDDGRGDVAALGADVVVDGRQPDAVERALDLASAFLDERDARGANAWRVADLPGLDLPNFRPERLSRPVRPGLAGRALVLAVPLGRLDAAQLAWLTGRELRVTPWRSIVLPDCAEIEAAAALGFGVRPDSPWADVSACTGRPGCAKALADVQTDARAAIGRWPGRVVHWSGCERRCGRPAQTGIDVVATGNGYEVRDSDA